MNTKNSNRVNMIRTVLNYCTDNAAKTAVIAAFVGHKTSADNKLVLIEQLDQLAVLGSEGVTLNTDQLRNTMRELAVKCGSAVGAYAATVNNSDLLNAVNYSGPKLDSLAKEQVANVCQGIHDAADDNIATAGAYGYVAGDVTALQTAIDLYRDSVSDTRDRIVDISQALSTINNLIREVISDLFKLKMDKMVRTLKVTEPDFVAGYLQRREIIDLGTTSAKIRGTVTSENNGLPLSNVKFTVYVTGTTDIVKQVITDAEGKYSAAQLPVGDYDLKWELEGYKPVTQEGVHVSAGKELRYNLVMEEGGITEVIEADVPSNSVQNIPVQTLNVLDDSTMRLEVTGSTLRFYASASNVGEPGAQYFEVAPGQIFTKTVIEWATVFGFDEDIEDFLNVKNMNGAAGHYKMKWENLGSGN